MYSLNVASAFRAVVGEGEQVLVGAPVAWLSVWCASTLHRCLLKPLPRRRASCCLRMWMHSAPRCARSLMARWEGRRVPQSSGVEGSLVAQLCACLDSLLSSPVVVLSTTNRLR